MIKENGTILIPFDFSVYSKVALMNSYNIAQYTKSKIILINFIKCNEDPHYSDLKKLCSYIEKEKRINCSYTTIFDEQLLYKIERLSVEFDASLIIMGLNPDIKFTNKFGFSKYASFIKRIKCPIITIRSTQFSPDCDIIIFPLDFSPESIEKLSITAQLANFYGSEVKIISAFSKSKPIIENRILKYLNEVKNTLKKQYIFCSNKSIASENVSNSIIEYSTKYKADLIIQMMEININPLKWIKGNDSLKIIDTSNIPVMTINPL